MECTEHDTLFMELVRDIATELELDTLCHKILVNVSRLTCADRASLFLAETCGEQQCLVPKLFDVTPQVDLDLAKKAAQDAMPIPFGVGIAGHVALTRRPLRIRDAYQDARFHPLLDRHTGYHTSSVLCLPICNQQGAVLGVAEIVNKIGKQEFSLGDQKVFERYLTFAGIGIQNAQLYKVAKQEYERNQVLLNLAKSIFEEQSTLAVLVNRIILQCHGFIPCGNTTLFVIQQAETQDFFSLGSSIFHKAFVMKNGEFEVQLVTGNALNALTLHDLAVHVAESQTPLRIKDFPSWQHAKKYKSISEYQHVLALPVWNGQKKVVGVLALCDQSSGKPFSQEDENCVKDFALFFGLGINNTQTYEEVCKLMAKQKVALECLSFHGRASEEEVEKLIHEEIPSEEYYQLSRYDFNDFTLTEDDTCKAAIRMFLECDLLSLFRIPYEVLCRWVLSVKKNYRPVKYHNWRHALNVAQTMYSLLRTGKMQQFMSDLEVLGLLVACLSHDLDHRGTNNAFQSKVMSPLAVLYSTSTLEHHHLDQCVRILSDDANNIFQSLTPEQYKKIMSHIEHFILSTDLAIYFRKKSKFIEMVENGEWDWQDGEHKELLCGMMMTSCDVSAIAKPWPIQHRVAKMVAEEFFEQGDMEKLWLNQQPIMMMDRDKQDYLPKMQVGFIDSICLPLYKALSESFPWVKPMYDSCLENRRRWEELASLVDMGLTWIDHSFIERPLESITDPKELEKLPLLVMEYKSYQKHVREKPDTRKTTTSQLCLPKSALRQRHSAPASPHEDCAGTLRFFGAGARKIRSMSLNPQHPALDALHEKHSRSKMCVIS